MKDRQFTVQQATVVTVALSPRASTALRVAGRLIVVAGLVGAALGLTPGDVAFLATASGAALTSAAGLLRAED